MENEKSKRSTSLGIMIGIFVFIIIMMGIIATVVHENHDTVRNFFMGNSQEEVLDTTQIVEPVFTIQEYLKVREDYRESQRIDSVFLSIPDVILIDLLSTYGTDLSIQDIVHIYESNKSTYNSVLSGARAQKYLEDSIQTTPKDTINQSFLSF